MTPTALPEKPDWYKDAIFYEVHVRAFYDSNKDGIGDFPGLTQKLSYIQDLGVTCIWLLPFYVSPLKDDGYDIADYYAVHPDYGTMQDVEQFLEAAHSFGIRVIADLVVNHTSSDNKWFQEARLGPSSPYYDYFVWSDDPTRYKDARIIFTDTEMSNWSFEPKVGKHYWHRFFSHQPDLNYENPKVQEEMLKIVDFWLAKGLDGFRVDAVPYLYERDGTDCENLPETHVFCKKLRAHVSHFHPHAVLLAEANQWPSQVIQYFGNGDEFHMCFNFPIMPRMFMAIKREDRTPIEEIITSLPPIPESCQWAMFLRNHDELSLEMVTDEERDYMYTEYARDSRMKLNQGIRRRLFPLMENNRRAIELLHSLLFTLPGSPILYYGDEIGMGDNVYLGDRNGVRTPMQWTGDRNAGFSHADPSRLYSPPVSDPGYNFQGVNAEALLRTPSSFLNWMKRIIKVRKNYPAFARGRVIFLRPNDKRILCYLCIHDKQVMLVVNNLSQENQFAEIDLKEYRGYVPHDVFGKCKFPAIQESNYVFTLGAYGFYWFELCPPSG
ncbi:hypothetical protein BH09SUM1_BH09SUM1_16790 [soil metagenome]